MSLYRVLNGSLKKVTSFLDLEEPFFSLRRAYERWLYQAAGSPFSL